MMMSSAALASGNERGNDEENVVDVSATNLLVGAAAILKDESCDESTDEERRWGVADRWKFTDDQLKDTPSRKCGVDPVLETKYRRHTAKFISDLAGCLEVSRLTANSGIVMMHRFYMYHSFTKFNLFETGMTCFFLACKAEEQLRKLRDIVGHARVLLAKPSADLVAPADNFTRCIGMYKRRLLEGDSVDSILEEMISKIVDTELIVLGTLGFDLSIDQAHTYVAQGCKNLSLPLEISRKAYQFATASLIYTRMCLRHMPKFVACVCIDAAIKESGWDFRGNPEKEWWLVIDKHIERNTLTNVTAHFLKSQHNGKNPGATNCIVARGTINGTIVKGPNGAHGVNGTGITGIRFGVRHDCSVIKP